MASRQPREVILASYDCAHVVVVRLLCHLSCWLLPARCSWPADCTVGMFPQPCSATFAEESVHASDPVCIGIWTITGVCQLPRQLTGSTTELQNGDKQAAEASATDNPNPTVRSAPPPSALMLHCDATRLLLPVNRQLQGGVSFEAHSGSF